MNFEEKTLGGRRIGAYAVVIVLLILFVQRFLLVELFVRRCGTAIVAAIVVALAMTGCAFLLHRARTIDPATALLVGYPIFGTICFLVALLAINRVTMAVVTVALAIAGGFGVAPAILPALRRRRRPPGRLPALHAADVVAAAMLVVLAVLAFLAAQAPAIHLDEVAYHLSVPFEWVKEGRAVDLPLISHSYFPQGTEGADLPLLAFLGAMRGGIASHFLHLLAAIATVVVALRVANGSVVVATAIISTPALAITAGWAQADWPLLGICLVLFAAVRDGDDAGVSGAVAAGLLTKYTFVPFVAIAAIVSRRWRAIAIGIAIGSIFFIRNLVLTGSPVAPFLTAASPHVGSYRQLSLEGYVFDPMWVDEALGVAMFALPLLASGLFAAITAGAGVLLLVALTPSARIIVPFLAVPALTARERGPVLQWLLVATIVLQTFVVALYINSSHPFELLNGRASDEQYVASNRASFPASRWIDSQVPPGSRVLLVGVNETYWFSTPVRGAGNFDSERMSRYLADPANLARDGITHVALMAKYRGRDAAKVEERETALTPPAQRGLTQALLGSTLIGAREDARLYRLK